MTDDFTIYNGKRVAKGWPEKVEQAQLKTTVTIRGVVMQRIPYGKEGRGWGSAHIPCHDCVARKGQYHVPGCDMERCPACRDQAFLCGCEDAPG
ncbi:MAG: hypothetical protein AB7T63_02300 [Planctomycetota bacterium]